MNAAAIWDLPVIFACENNLYGASTPIGLVSKLDNLADRASAYGIPGEVVDGNDVFAVNEAATRAVSRARSGSGPTLLELKTYRIGGHSRNDACGYRTKEEEKLWLEKEPIRRARTYILESKLSTEDEISKLEQSVLNDIEEAVLYAKNSPDPKPEDALNDVFFEGGEQKWLP